MRIKDVKICIHGFFEYKDEYFPRDVVADFIETKGGIFKVTAEDVDKIIIGRINYNTKLTKRSKLKLQAIRNIPSITAIAFFDGLSASDKALLRKLNTIHSKKAA
ncbi:MAG: hypothetical protein ABL930_11550 [Pseudobdellovibrio sp.]